MKKSTATNVSQNMLAMAVLFLIMIIATLVFSLPKNVTAEVLCLTDPWGPFGEDQRCPATVTITPATRSVAPGASVSINLYAFTHQQFADGGWMDVEATMSNGVTLYTGWPSGTGFGPTGLNVPSGPLANSVTMHIWGMTNQGIFDEDTDFINVVPTSCSYTGTLNWVEATGLECSVAVAYSNVPIGNEVTSTDSDASGNTYTGWIRHRCNAAGGWDYQAHSCSPRVNCVGSWSNNSTCNATCGGGVLQQVYTVTTPASGGGTACPFTNGATQWGSTSCNTQLCPSIDLNFI